MGPLEDTPHKTVLLNRLKTWCRMKRGNYARVSKALGVSRGTVHRWISGKRSPEFRSLVLLSEFFKLEYCDDTASMEGLIAPRWDETFSAQERSETPKMPDELQSLQAHRDKIEDRLNKLERALIQIGTLTQTILYSQNVNQPRDNTAVQKERGDRYLAAAHQREQELRQAYGDFAGLWDTSKAKDDAERERFEAHNEKIRLYQKKGEEYFKMLQSSDPEALGRAHMNAVAEAIRSIKLEQDLETMRRNRQREVEEHQAEIERLRAENERLVKEQLRISETHPKSDKA